VAQVAIHAGAPRLDFADAPHRRTESGCRQIKLFSERQEWTFGETLEYALDALELAMAKTARIPSDPLRPRPPRR
jgi:hypothetical protein